MTNCLNVGDRVHHVHRANRHGIIQFFDTGQQTVLAAARHIWAKVEWPGAAREVTFVQCRQLRLVDDQKEPPLIPTFDEGQLYTLAEIARICGTNAKTVRSSYERKRDSKYFAPLVQPKERDPLRFDAKAARAITRGLRKNNAACSG